MNKKNIFKKNKKDIKSNLYYSRGFTIMEAIIAIFILTISVTSMLGVTATSTSFARYSNNEITANYLTQEAIDSIRNSRDTIAFKMNEDLGGGNSGWEAFLNRYGWKNGTGSDKCFDQDNGCYLEMEDFDPEDAINFVKGVDVHDCASGYEYCNPFNYSDNSEYSLFFNYKTGESLNESIFSRKVIMKMGNTNDEVIINAYVYWSNGNSSSIIKQQKLEMRLLNWQKV